MPRKIYPSRIYVKGGVAAGRFVEFLEHYGLLPEAGDT